MSKEEIEKELDKLFTYHPPTEEQKISYGEIRNKARELAKVIFENCPDSGDRTNALKGVRGAVSWANASIATQGHN